jgi:hypothetical protein
MAAISVQATPADGTLALRTAHLLKGIARFEAHELARPELALFKPEA